MRHILYLPVMLLFLYGSVTAQQREIKGVVKDGNDTPLVGANVVIKGSTTGTTTDSEGNFILTFNVTAKGDTLKISYLGFQEKLIPILEKSTYIISLEAKSVGLNEVVAVGYGTQKKVNLTGAVSSVSGKELAKMPVLSTSAALEGLASGVTARQTSGRPGGDGADIKIRGIGTLGNSDPLIMIDGVEGNLDRVDPNDIANISILKDAASAAIYGSRAANGVILITTKSGRQGKMEVTYNMYVGLQKFTDLPEFADGYTYMTAFNQAFVNEGKDPIYSDDYLKDYQENYRKDPDHYPNTDWQKLAYTGSGFLQHHYLNISGGNKMIKVSGSLAYQDQKGIMPHYSTEEYSLRLNTEMDVLDNLQMRLYLNGMHSPTLQPATGSMDLITQINRLAPVYNAVLTDGRYGTAFSGGNPIAVLQIGGLRQTINESFAASFQANYQPFSGADIEFKFSPQFRTPWTKSFVKSIDTYNPDSDVPEYSQPEKNKLSESSARAWQNTLNLLIRYDKSFQEHNFHLLLGYEQIGYHNESFSASRSGFPLQDFQELDAGSIDEWSNGGSGYEWALRSVFGRLTYDFMGKYLFEANLRRDGSSRFATGNKYSMFPSFSAGWRVSEEHFLKDNNWLSNLKVRASWGQLGNQQIGNYPFASTINLGMNYILGDAPANGAAQTDMANSDISWETTTTKDLGIDLGLFKDKLSVTYDYYIRNTTGILLNLPIPAIIGLNSPYQNAGIVRNTGWDLSITYNNYKGAFKYNVGLNLSDVRNEVVDLKGTGPYISDYSIVKEGYPINELYGYKAIGLFQTKDQVKESPTQFGDYGPGDIMYQDIKRDSVINADDRVELGSQIPRYTFGVSFYGQYKNFDLSLLIQGVGKRKIFLYRDAVWAFYNAGKIQKWQLDYWTPDNPDSKYPRLIAETTHNNFQNSSFWVFDASYARLKNIQLGYTFPKNLMKNIFINDLRLYISGWNLFTIKNMPKGWDPERNSGDSGIYPVISTYTFGLNLTF